MVFLGRWFVSFLQVYRVRVRACNGTCIRLGMRKSAFGEFVRTNLLDLRERRCHRFAEQISEPGQIDWVGNRYGFFDSKRV